MLAESDTDSTSDNFDIESEIVNVPISFEEKVPVATQFIRSYANVLTTPREVKAKNENKNNVSLNASELGYKIKGKSWADDDSDSDVEYDSDPDDNMGFHNRATFISPFSMCM